MIDIVGPTVLSGGVLKIGAQGLVTGVIGQLGRQDLGDLGRGRERRGDLGRRR